MDDCNMQGANAQEANTQVRPYYALAIDLGGSDIKVAMVADTGKIIAHAAAANPISLLPDGGAEQDARDG